MSKSSYQKLKRQLLQSQMEVSHLKHEIRRIVINKDESTIRKWKMTFDMQDSMEHSIFFGNRQTAPFVMRGIIPLINKKKDSDE